MTKKTSAKRLAASRMSKQHHPETTAAWKRAHPEYGADWRKVHREEAKEATKVWKRLHPGHSAEWFKAHPNYIVEAGRLWRKRLDVKLTGHVRPKRCEVCRRSGVPIHYDHCHKSGLFRGWLCRDCNAVLGYVRDSTKVLQRLIDHLNTRPTAKGQMAKDQKAYAVKQDFYSRKNKIKGD